MAEFFGRQIKSTWTEDEYAQLSTMAAARGVKLGPLIREIVRESLRTELTLGERLTVTAIRELQRIHLDVLSASLNKELTLGKLQTIEASARVRRGDLLVAFTEEMQ